MLKKKAKREKEHKIRKHFYGLILIMLMCFGIGMERLREIYDKKGKLKAHKLVKWLLVDNFEIQTPENAKKGELRNYTADACV